MGPRRIIASRALMEIGENAIVNLGIGMPEGIARIAAEYGVLDRFTLTVESGPIGGIPAGGWSFGASLYPQAIIDQPAQFDFYDGHGLDFAALGAAQIDTYGNVNVSKFGSRLPGVGGFVNITQTAKKLVFCSTMTAEGLDIMCRGGNLIIVSEGRVKKFIEKVEQVSFSAFHSLEAGQEVLYITERAVFCLTAEGLELTEVAPGIDIDRQVLANMSIGAAVLGMRPIVEIMFSDFIMLTLEQIANQAAKMRYMFGGKAKVPMVVRTPGGGGIGLAAQHSQSIEGIFLGFPGLKIVMPSSAYDAKGLLASAIKDDNPVLVFEHKLLYQTKENVPEEAYELALGKAKVKLKGSDITVIATSFMVQKALSVAKKLGSQGISVEVVDPCTIKPLDIDTIAQSVKKTGKAVLVEEACYTGGFSCYLASEIMKHCFDWLDAPVERVTSLDCPIPYENKLEKVVIPDEQKIEKAVKRLLGISNN